MRFSLCSIILCFKIGVLFAFSLSILIQNSQCKEGARYVIFVLSGILEYICFNIFSVKMMKVILKKIHWHGDLTNQQLESHKSQSLPLMIFQKVILKSQNQTTSPTQIANKIITNRKNYRNEKSPYYGRFYHHSSQNLRRIKLKNSPILLLTRLKNLQKTENLRRKHPMKILQQRVIQRKTQNGRKFKKLMKKSSKKSVQNQFRGIYLCITLVIIRKIIPKLEPLHLRNISAEIRRKLTIRNGEKSSENRMDLKAKIWKKFLSCSTKNLKLNLADNHRTIQIPYTSSNRQFAKAKAEHLMSSFRIIPLMKIQKVAH